MAYIEGESLYEYTVENNGCLLESQIKMIIYQLLHAADYMHRRHVIHRDIKLENVLINSDYNVFLIDFGWAVHNYSNKLRGTVCGTLLCNFFCHTKANFFAIPS